MLNMKSLYVRIELIAVLCAITLLAGCASVQEYKQERQLLFNPARVNESPDPASRAYAAGEVQISAYYKALAKAQTNYDVDPPRRATPVAVANYVEEGIALNTAYCRRWFHRVDDTQRQFAIGSKDVNIITSLGTAIMGIAGASANAVALWGAGLTAMNGFGDNFNSALLTAPTAKGVESKIMQMMNGYGEALRGDARTLSFPAAFTRLEAMADICTFAGIRDAVDSSLRATEASVSPSGTVTMSAAGASASTYQKDDSGDRIVAYWVQGGKVNEANAANIKIWMVAHGIDTSVPFFAHAKLYEAARKQLVADLAIGVAQ